MPSPVFTLETVAAKHGDCLLLHWGPRNNPRLILIDGGPRGVFTKFLSPRLKQLRRSRGEPLRFDIVMISHVDDDHIKGILDLTDYMKELDDEGRNVPYEIDGLWLNSFDDVVANAASSAGRPLGALVRPTGVGGGLAHSAATVASVGQGRTLRDRAHYLGTPINGGDELIVAGWIWQQTDGLSLQILGPRQERIKEFRKKWDKELKKKGWAAGVDEAEVAAFLDTSAYNLASTIVYAKLGSKTMLLTGDARGDDILEGLEEGGLLTGSSMKVNILKVPHHGSNRNVTEDFFRTVRADNYVISGNGEHRNPDIDTLQMIVAARGNQNYTVHCTYRNGIKGLQMRLNKFLGGLSTANRRKFVFRHANRKSLKVELGAKLLD